MSLTIDRIENDDVGGDPAKLAVATIKRLPDASKPIPVREIAAAIDIYEIREEPLSKLEAGLIVAKDKSEGAILVHRDRPETRKRYTIAHEIGHYVNRGTSRIARGFPVSCARCGDRAPRAQRPGDQDGVQANQFAAELLMPRQETGKSSGARLDPTWSNQHG